MDKHIIDTFWKKRASEGKGRWTDNALLNYELGWLVGHLPPHARILDLGSGPGELSSRLMPANGTLTLVEKYPDFLKLAPAGPGIRHVCCDVMDFAPPEHYDLILIFGVITHLTEEEERMLCRKAARCLSSVGTLVVKNQVGIGPEKLVSGYSTGLEQEYCGRYPGLEQQLLRLKDIFHSVETVQYPDRFNPWPDTKHVAFVCKQPRV